jgi:methylenetetrahydrofolate reductase (NADPH)
MPILPFGRKTPAPRGDVADLLAGFSIEVMPRTAEKVENFRAILPPGTRVYVAHIDGTPIDDMVRTARRLREDGFPVMPHIPARSLTGRAEFAEWLTRYRDEAGVGEALVLAGGAPVQRGEYGSAMALLETGLFDRHGFTRLHVAGHPEGNRDIDPDGGTRAVDEAARWKADFAARTGARMALVTQFVFDADPLIGWADRLADAGIGLPVHAGVAGPAKLQTLLKFAIACGVGPSLGVLQKRAADVTKLLLPYEPTAVLERLAEARSKMRGSLAGVHFFPLGGIGATADYAARMTARAGGTAAARR